MRSCEQKFCDMPHSVQGGARKGRLGGRHRHILNPFFGTKKWKHKKQINKRKRFDKYSGYVVSRHCDTKSGVYCSVILIENLCQAKIFILSPSLRLSLSDLVFGV